MEKDIVEKVRCFPKALERSCSLFWNIIYKENLHVSRSGQTDPYSKRGKAGELS